MLFKQLSALWHKGKLHPSFILNSVSLNSYIILGHSPLSGDNDQDFEITVWNKVDFNIRIFIVFPAWEFCFDHDLARLRVKFKKWGSERPKY